LLFFYLANKKIQKGPYEEDESENRLMLKDIAEQFENRKK
jgi:hypothetical protein